MEFLEQFRGWLVPVGFVLGGLFAGLVAEKLILPKVKKIAGKTRLEILEKILSALKGMVFFWFALAGFTGAAVAVPMNPALLHIIQRSILVLVLGSATLISVKIAVGLLMLHGRRTRGDIPTISLFTNITKLIVFSIGLLVILQSLGISIAPILTALGVGGLAVALALQDTLSNLFAGFHILASHQVRQGDFVHLESGEEGYVTDITWRNTTIRALPNNMVIVPNSKMASSIVTNYNQPAKDVHVYVQVGVHYASDLKHVEKVTIEVAGEVQREVPGAVTDFEPYIRYHTFNDFSIDFRVIMMAGEYFAHHLITHEFIKRLNKRYHEEGIVIPFPIRTLDIPKQQGSAAMPGGEKRKGKTGLSGSTPKKTRKS